jgi:hypothetical protein
MTEEIPMGEASPEAWAMLTSFLGQPPRYEYRDNLVILHLGTELLTASLGALYSDPSVFGGEDRLYVSWAGRHLTLEKDARGNPSAPDDLPNGAHHE